MRVAGSGLMGVERRLIIEKFYVSLTLTLSQRERGLS
jgi:hypothetical protein